MISILFLSISKKFFDGFGYTLNGTSYPTTNDWTNAINDLTDELQVYGLSYIINNTNETITVYNGNCVPLGDDNNFEFNVGINFDIFCND